MGRFVSASRCCTVTAARLKVCLLVLWLMGAVALVPWWGAAAPLMAQQPEEKIVDVVVQGSQRVADRRVLSSAQINVGDTYTVFLVRNALESLWQTGLYADIDILAQQVEGGLRIIIRIEENPIISKFSIEGCKKIKEQDLKDDLTLRVGGLFSHSKIRETRNKISELYRNKGFYNTKVEIDTLYPKIAGRIEVTFKVAEGRKIKITRIEFEGNGHFPDSKLRGAISTKEKSFIKFWRRGGYEDEKFQKDLSEKLPEFYQKNGFVNIQVLGHKMEFSQGNRNVTLRITVDEGLRYYLGTLSVSGNAHFPDEIVLGTFKLAEGSVFNEEAMEESMQAVRELYGDEGYIYLQAQPMREFRDSLINISLVIQEGEPASVRKIVIMGNESTFEDVIRRRIGIYPGDLFRQPLVKMSYHSLVNSGFFEQDIGIVPRPVSEGGEVDLMFRVKEKSTGSAQFGAGFGGGYGVTGFLELMQSNLFGRGKSVQLRLEFGTRMTNIDLSYSDPYFLNTPVSFSVGFFNMRRRLRNDPFQDKYRGFYTRFGFPVPAIDYTRLFVGYSLQSVDIAGDSSLVYMYTGANVNDYPQISSKVSFTLSRDTRLNLQHPQGGTRQSLTMELSGGPFGGNIGYQKYEVNSDWHVPTFSKDFVLSLKTRGGMLKPFGGARSPLVDPREMFIMGGTGYGRDTDIHLRGYEDRTVGVDGRQYNRGSTFFIMALEEEIKVAEKVYGVLFYEAGNVWRDLEDFNLSKLRRSAGFGVRLETPMGPLGLELGYGFDQTDAYGNPIKGKWIPHFRFGRF
ncbi:MAG: outer membrane protein assembly factor BamA [Gemmatimonadota bacterium]|nr:outer membrane protein assembly factor BamA [Gemmatimonadota bacterium]